MMKIPIELLGANEPTIVLRLSSQAEPQLTHAGFCALGVSTHCLRGRVVYPGEITGTFAWSRAVQALTVLFLRAAAPQSDTEHPPAISGEDGSLAASLDYAISKQPLWLCDLFGIDSRGTCLVRRALLRSNPERKRPGPVTITMNEKFLSRKNVRIYIGEALARDPDLLARLADLIAHAASLKSDLRDNNSPPRHDSKRKVA